MNDLTKSDVRVLFLGRRTNLPAWTSVWLYDNGASFFRLRLRRLKKYLLWSLASRSAEERRHEHNNDMARSIKFFAENISHK